VPLNLELGVTEEMVALALEIHPDFACMVPEKREEVTTEGGLDVASRQTEVAGATARLRDAGVKVSLFIDPDAPQVEAAARTGAEMIELHTGAFANAFGAERDREIARLISAARTAHALGLQVNAGHGLNYANLPEIFAVPHLAELNIGHTIVSRAIRVGMRQAVREMVEAMEGEGEITKS
jgi:pyridoxine 5-phosphate synthase